MPPKSLPTGVEIHSGKLRIWFMYKGARCRESLSAPPTPKNIRLAAEKRTSVCHAIRTGTFDYGEWFPSSKNALKFSLPVQRELTLNRLCDKWLELKRIEVTPATIKNYEQRLKQVRLYISGDMLVKDITQSSLLDLRKAFLENCSVSTTNTYMRTIKGLFGFAIDNQFCDQRILSGLKELKQDKSKPNPLSQSEFHRILGYCLNDQDRNFWQLAVYTGMRHGELLALAWEDIDLETGTISVRRNLTLEGVFKLPKTRSGERVINLLEPAIEALKQQQLLTYMYPTIEIDVLQREHGKLMPFLIRPVFSPKVTATRETKAYYFHTSIHDKWTAVCRRSKVTYRRPYQTRHTYACWMLSAGANPTFIANQMGHSSAKEIYQTYGDWVSEHTPDQLDMLNQKYGKNAPYMPLKFRK